MEIFYRTENSDTKKTLLASWGKKRINTREIQRESEIFNGMGKFMFETKFLGNGVIFEVLLASHQVSIPF